MLKSYMYIINLITCLLNLKIYQPTYTCTMPNFMCLAGAVDNVADSRSLGTQWKEPARGGPCYELMSSTNAFQPFPPSGDSTPEVERCP